MSNPTANFGWVMPTATDLVTDLPADFAVFGQAVDTSMQYLLGGTTGQVLSKTSGTNMAFTWVSPQVGDITAVNAGTGISGGGTSGDVTVTNSMATAMTTSGDLIQATGSGTFARLGTGTSGQYLTTNGTTNSWATPNASGMTLISTTTLSGSSVTLSSIPQTYNDLYIIVQNYRQSGGGGLSVRPNSVATGYATQNSNTAPISTGTAFGSTEWSPIIQSNTTTGNGLATMTIPSYTNAVTWKLATSNAYTNDPTNGAQFNWVSRFYISSATTAISSLYFFSATAGTFSAGTVLLYGVK